MAICKVKACLAIVVLCLVLANCFYFGTPLHWQLTVQKRIRGSSTNLRHEASQLIGQFAESDKSGLTLCGDKLPKSLKKLNSRIIGDQGEICVWLSKNYPDILIISVEGISVKYTIIAPMPNQKTLDQVRNNVVHRTNSHRSLRKINSFIYEVR